MRAVLPTSHAGGSRWGGRVIGVGRTDSRPPLPPNRTCGSPAYGSPVGGSPPRGSAGASVSRGQGEQPLLRKEGVWPLAFFHPLFEGRQHALGPDRRFHPRPPGADLSGLFSPCGHSRRFLFHQSVLHASTSLPPFAPRPLQALPSSYEGSDSCQAIAALRLSPSMNTVLVPPRRSPRFTCTAFQPFRLHPPDSPHRRFRTLPLSAMGSRRSFCAGPDFATESQARRSARPYRVRQPTDWSFTSHCFGPRLQATPLCLVSGRRAHA